MSFRIGHRNSCSPSKAPHPGRVDTSKQLKELRTRLEAMSLDAFIITRDDEHQVSINSVISIMSVCVWGGFLCMVFLKLEFSFSFLSNLFFHFIYVMLRCTEYQISDRTVNIPCSVLYFRHFISYDSTQIVIRTILKGHLNMDNSK